MLYKLLLDTIFSQRGTWIFRNSPYLSNILAYIAYFLLLILKLVATLIYNSSGHNWGESLVPKISVPSNGLSQILV